MLLQSFTSIAMLAMAVAAPLPPVNSLDGSYSSSESYHLAVDIPRPTPYSTGHIDKRTPAGIDRTVSIDPSDGPSAPKRQKTAIDNSETANVEAASNLNVEETSNLEELLASFDMRTRFLLQDNASPDTTSLSVGGVESLPAALKLVKGSFDPEQIIRQHSDRLVVSKTDYQTTSTIFAATRLSKNLVPKVSGEGGLSHLLYQQVGGPINQLLAAMGIAGSWSIKAHGPAPVEDWRFVSDTDTTAGSTTAQSTTARSTTAVVMELKTSASLEKGAVDKMMAALHMFSIKKMPLENPTPRVVKRPTKQPRAAKNSVTRPKVTEVDSLNASYGKKNYRGGRPSEVKAMEQVGHRRSPRLHSGYLPDVFCRGGYRYSDECRSVGGLAKVIK